LLLIFKPSWLLLSSKFFHIPSEIRLFRRIFFSNLNSSEHLWRKKQLWKIENTSKAWLVLFNKSFIRWDSGQSICSLIIVSLVSCFSWFPFKTIHETRKEIMNLSRWIKVSETVYLSLSCTPSLLNKLSLSCFDIIINLIQNFKCQIILIHFGGIRHRKVTPPSYNFQRKQSERLIGEFLCFPWKWNLENFFPFQSERWIAINQNT